MAVDYIHARNGIFQFRINVPKDQISKFGRREITKSLKTRDRRQALVNAAPLIEFWSKLFQSNGPIPDRDIQIADVVGTSVHLSIPTYYGEKQIAEMDTPQQAAIMEDRLKVLARIKKPTRAEIAALAGVVEEVLTLDGLFERYCDLASGKWTDLAKREKDKKFNRYKRPIEDLKEFFGRDVNVLKITVKMANDYAISLGKRIGTIKSTTAIPRLRFIKAMFARVLKEYPGHANPFVDTEIDFNGNDDETRRPFSELEVVALLNYMQNSRGNPEAKAIMRILLGTGAHAKEICLLTPSDIRITGEKIPHILIGVNANRKSLKTGGARHRAIPLVGDALEAARPFEKTAFPRYARSGGSDAFSQNANKIIKKIQLEPDATTYSARHRMVDLLRDAEGVNFDVLQSIVGHNTKTQTDDYGVGHGLPKKLKALEAAMVAAQKKLSESININP